MQKRFLVLCLLFFAAVAPAQTDLYKRYASQSNIRVASVSNFTLDTGITADVTLLEALDEEGWQWLCREFGLALPSADQQKQMADGWDVVMFAQRDRRNPALPAPIANEQIDVLNLCYVGVSYLSQRLYIFCCNGVRQSDVVVDYLIEKMRHAAGGGRR